MKVKMKQSLIIRLVNNSGCVIRVALILEKRGYTIESLQMKHSSEYSDMNLIVSGEPEKFEQVQKQLSKLIDVLSVREGIREERRTPVRWTDRWTNVLTRSVI
jgi:acetolactate synthase small subunit